MTDPLAFLPLALAAANGSIDGMDCRRLVAAGVALLQRTGPLVRTLQGGRSALLLANDPRFLVALAASDGRGALLLDPREGAHHAALALGGAGARAVFTVREFEALVPADMPRVLLDEAPLRATWRHGSQARTVDLSLHDGLRLEGESGAEGAPEEALVLPAGETVAPTLGLVLSHRDVMAAARAVVQSVRLGTRDHTLTLVPFCTIAGLVHGLIAPLLAGGRVTTAPRAAPDERIALLEQGGVSTMVAGLDDYRAIAQQLESRNEMLDAPVLQRCVAVEASIDESLQARWLQRAGVPISHAHG